jgi:predicted nucleic acid-binding protein
MNRLLLDTSAYSAFMRGEKFVVESIQEADEIALTPIILGELKAGFLRGSRRKENEAILGKFLESPRASVLPLDEGTAERYAAIVDALRTAGTPIPTNDLWIAASAMQHGFKVLTMDAHFRKIPQIVLV